MTRSIIGAVAVAMFVTAQPATAQPGPEGRGKGAQERQQPPAAEEADDPREKRREMRKERRKRREGREGREAKPEERGASAEERPEERARPGDRQAARKARAGARKGGPEARRARRDVRDAVAKGDVKAAREAAQEAVRARREARAERGKKDRPGAKKRMRERRRAGDRAGGADRARRARWAALQARYGRPEANPKSVSPRLKAELRRHGRRLAQIERIRELAEDKDNESLGERAEVLLEMELARHESRLERLGADALAADEGPEEVQ